MTRFIFWDIVYIAVVLQFMSDLFCEGKSLYNRYQLKEGKIYNQIAKKYITVFKNGNVKLYNKAEKKWLTLNNEEAKQLIQSTKSKPLIGGSLRPKRQELEPTPEPPTVDRGPLVRRMQIAMEGAEEHQRELEARVRRQEQEYMRRQQRRVQREYDERQRRYNRLMGRPDRRSREQRRFDRELEEEKKLMFEEERPEEQILREMEFEEEQQLEAEAEERRRRREAEERRRREEIRRFDRELEEEKKWLLEELDDTEDEKEILDEFDEIQEQIMQEEEEKDEILREEERRKQLRRFGVVPEDEDEKERERIIRELDPEEEYFDDRGRGQSFKLFNQDFDVNLENRDPMQIRRLLDRMFENREDEASDTYNIYWGRSIETALWQLIVYLRRYKLGDRQAMDDMYVRFRPVIFMSDENRLYLGPTYTRRRNTLDNMLALIDKLSELRDQEIQGSDKEQMFDFINAVGVQIDFVSYQSLKARYDDMMEKKEEKERKKRRDVRVQHGRKSPYINITNINLTRLQIYTENEPKDYTQCLLFAMKGQLKDEKKYQQLKLMVNNEYFPMKDLKIIAEKLGVRINLTYQNRKTGQFRNTKYGDGDPKKDVFLGLINGHYFNNKECVFVTPFALKNYGEVYKLKDWNRIVRRRTKEKGYLYAKEPKMFAHLALRYMIRHGLLIEDEEMLANDPVAEQHMHRIKDMLKKNKLTEIQPLPLERINAEKRLFIEEGNNHGYMGSYYGLKGYEELRSTEDSRETAMEYVPIKIVEQLLNKIDLVMKYYAKYKNSNKETIKETKASLQNKLKLIQQVTKTGNYWVTYHRTSCGRRVANCSLGIQQLPRGLRGLLCGVYKDVDMVNAHPVIAVKIFEDNNIQCPKLKEYVMNRDQVFKRYAKYGIKRGEVKQAFLATLNGGLKDLNNLIKRYSGATELITFKKEITYNMERYIELHPKEFEIHKKNYKKDGIVEGSFFNKQLTLMEDAILKLAVDTFKQKGAIYYNYYTNIYDGFQFIPEPQMHEKDIENVISIVNDRVNRRFGFSKDTPMLFKIKEIEQPITFQQLDIIPPERMVPHHTAACRLRSGLNYDVVFADFECDVTGDTHKVYSAHYVKLNADTDLYDSRNYDTFIGENCVEQMLDKLRDKSLVIFHNLNYDKSFIITLKNIIVQNKGTIIKDNKFMTMKCRYKYKDLYFKCSYKVIPMPLASFPSSFNIKGIKKEAYPYEAYTVDSMSQKVLSLKAAKNCRTFRRHNKLWKIFQENLSKNNWYCDKDGNKVKSTKATHFDHIAYNRFYGEQDVRILAIGYESMRLNVRTTTSKVGNSLRREMNKQLTKKRHVPKAIDIDKAASISSIGHKNLVNKGAYHGVYKLTGFEREFIQSTVEGGRVGMRFNNKIRVDDNEIYMTEDGEEWETLIYSSRKKLMIVDFDACSLYPSAMAEIPGLPIGLPKILKPNQCNMNFLKTIDYYYVAVKITAVNRQRRAFATTNYKDMDGARINNNHHWVGETFRIGKIGLEDMIEYHDVEFEIIEGMYWDQGFNTIIKEEIKQLYNERLELKKIKNLRQLICKLLMNSSYGKTIIKANKKEIFICNDQEEYIRALNKFGARMMEYDIPGSDKKIICADKSIYEHESYPHIGSMILEMSKRIMNRVFMLAEDLGLLVLYMDTDSIQIPQEHLNILEKAYNKKYKTKLIGNQMGQFHSDFDCPKEYYEEGFTPYADQCRYVGKKAYICRVICNSRGDSYYHMRMKGVSSEAIKGYAKAHNITEMDVYDQLYDGDEIEFDIGKYKVTFKQGLDQTIRSISTLTRKVKF